MPTNDFELTVPDLYVASSWCSSCSEMLPVFVVDNQRAAAAQAARVRREGRHDRPVCDGGDLRDPGRLRRGAHQDHPTQRYVA